MIFIITISFSLPLHRFSTTSIYSFKVQCSSSHCRFLCFDTSVSCTFIAGISFSRKLNTPLFYDCQEYKLLFLSSVVEYNFVSNLIKTHTCIRYERKVSVICLPFWSANFLNDERNSGVRGREWYRRLIHFRRKGIRARFRFSRVPFPFCNPFEYKENIFWSIPAI